MNAPRSSSPKSPSLGVGDELRNQDLVSRDPPQIEERRGRRQVLLRERRAPDAFSTW